MDAIDMVDDRSNVNLDRCIGCGNCIATCETESMVLVKREPEKVPPENKRELYQEIFKSKKSVVE